MAVAFGMLVTRGFSTSVARADGSRRKLEVTPEQRSRKTVVRIDDGGHVIEVPPDHPIVTGNVVVSVADMRPMLAAFEKYGAHGANSRCKQ